VNRLVAVSMREAYVTERGESRDCIETAWWQFLRACRLTPVCLPNDPVLANALLDQSGLLGLILTGGGDVSQSAGDETARDEVEAISIKRMMQADRPIIGVCRGLQKLCTTFGGSLQSIAGHVRTAHRIYGTGVERTVNSFHNYQIAEMPAGFAAKARAEDGSIEWIENRRDRLVGVMWHPERMGTPDPVDVELFESVFEEKGEAR
jgi:putative glutamine amidotransferase